MIAITFFDHAGAAPGKTIQAREGQSLMRAAITGDIDGIAADCGGALTCATCHVMVREPWLGHLPPMAADENDMLDFAAADRQPNSRLSCQITLTAAMDGMEVDLPPNQY
jgi:2Fe-2S ferredoxin